MKAVLNCFVLYLVLSFRIVLSVGDDDKKVSNTDAENKGIASSEASKESDGAQGIATGLTEIKLIKLDIKNKESSEYWVFEKQGSVGTFYIRPGFGIRKLISSEYIIWKATKDPVSGYSESYATKVVIDGIGSKGKLVTVYLANGKKEIFSKSSKSERQQNESSPETDKVGVKITCHKKRERKLRSADECPSEEKEDNIKETDEKSIEDYQNDSTPSETSGDSNVELSEVGVKNEKSDMEKGSDNDQASGIEKEKDGENVEKASEVAWSEQPDDVVIITRRQNENNSEYVEVENDCEGYKIIRGEEDYYKFEIEKNVQLIEVKFKNGTVWKHSGEDSESFPKSVIYRQEANLFVVNYENKFELCAQMSDGEWYRQSYNQKNQ